MKPLSLDLPPGLVEVHHSIASCERCPRLRQYCRAVARDKKPAHRNDTYWGRPVPGFGDPDARLLLLGLAPAAHGANRTGFANIATSKRVDDGLQLTDAYILSAVRCAPPDNKPLTEEITRCLDH